jgi:hypothetical protein
MKTIWLALCLGLLLCVFATRADLGPTLSRELFIGKSDRELTGFFDGVCTKAQISTVFSNTLAPVSESSDFKNFVSSVLPGRKPLSGQARPVSYTLQWDFVRGRGGGGEELGFPSRDLGLILLVYPTA